ncbi:MAG: hypothetical protein P1P82_15675 [Bacteroidales bacterium]|nr:hypothetical protein [Bacteroidales bacterium]
MKTQMSRSCRTTRTTRSSRFPRLRHAIWPSHLTTSATFSVLLTIACSSTLHAQVWNRVVADSTGNKQGAYCKIALNPQDEPIIAHIDGDFLDLVLLEKENGEWNRQVIDTSGYTGWSTGLAIDAGGDLHFCFENGGLIYEAAATFGVNYLTRGQDTWTKTTIESYKILLPLSSTHIALTSDGKPVVGYWNLNDEFYYLAYLENGEWVKKQSPQTRQATQRRSNSAWKPGVTSGFPSMTTQEGYFG